MIMWIMFLLDPFSAEIQNKGIPVTSEPPGVLTSECPTTSAASHSDPPPHERSDEATLSQTDICKLCIHL